MKRYLEVIKFSLTKCYLLKNLGQDIPELISISAEVTDEFDKRIQTIINFIGEDFLGKKSERKV